MLLIMDTIMFGQRLRAARLARGLTQAHLAERIASMQPRISRLELGAAGIPTVATRVTLAEALGIEASWFLSADPNQSGGPS
jgi:transcriptional regulator with XRE-family HTH domain